MKTFFLTIATCFCVSAYAQEATPDTLLQPRPDRITASEPAAKKSPMNSTSLRTPAGYARLVYSQPMLRGRKMLGDQNPFGTIWRLGANEATEIFTTADMTIGEETLPAGAYAVFAIPTEESWTLVFSSDLGQWGAYNYDEALDVLRVEAPVTEGDESYEAMTAYFEPDALNFAWGKARVTVPVGF